MLGVCNMLLSVLCDTLSILPGMLYPCHHGTCKSCEVMGAQCDKVKKKMGAKGRLEGKKIALTTMGKYDVRVFELGIAWCCWRS